MAGKKILIIDDEHSFLRLAQMLLSRRGYDVSVALSSSEGRSNLVKNAPADLIILDLMMPNENGFTFLTWLEKQDEKLKNIPVIVNTAKNLSDDEIVFLKTRSKGIILKGMNFTERLLAEIERILGKPLSNGPQK